jgi:hypothetical protein
MTKIITPKTINKPTYSFFSEIITILYHYNQFIKYNNYESTYNAVTSKKIPTPSYNNGLDNINIKIKGHILENMKHTFRYTLRIGYMNVKIDFVTYKKSKNKCDKNVKIIELILRLFIYISNNNINKCSQNLHIIIYLTNLKKTLPTKKNKLSSYNINTGYTYSCLINSELIIYREEEWVKVFIHELMHNLNFDNSSIPNKEIDIRINTILNIFPEYNLKNYEAYTEFWALILYVILSTFINSIQINMERLIHKIINNINIEITYSTYQAVKLLQNYNTDYNEFISNPNKNIFLKNPEIPPIISYYILKLILLTNYDKFIKFCIINNSKNNKLTTKIEKYPYYIIYKKGSNTNSLFVNYIKNNYINKSLINNINVIQDEIPITDTSIKMSFIKII